MIQGAGLEAPSAVSDIDGSLEFAFGTDCRNLLHACSVRLRSGRNIGCFPTSTRGGVNGLLVQRIRLRERRAHDLDPVVLGDLPIRLRIDRPQTEAWRAARRGVPCRRA